MSEESVVEKIEEKEASNGNAYYRVKTEQLKYPTIAWSVPANVSEGDKVRYNVNKDEDSWKLEDIELIANDVKESGDSEADANSREEGSVNSSNKGENTSSNKSSSSKDDRINKKVAFKEACETVRTVKPDLEGGEHIQLVSEYANGYYNILKSMGGGE